MARINNLKQYEQMCNSYEARILELESELNHVQQEYNELSFNYQEVVSQIETAASGINLDHINTLIKTMDTSGQFSIAKVIQHFVRMSEKEQRFLLGIANLIVEDVEKGELKCLH